MSKKAASALIGVLGLLSLFSSGCSTVAGPNFGMFNFPIPVSPYFQKRRKTGTGTIDATSGCLSLGRLRPARPKRRWTRRRTMR